MNGKFSQPIDYNKNRWGFVSRENAVKYIIRLRTLNIESKMTRVECSICLNFSYFIFLLTFFFSNNTNEICTTIIYCVLCIIFICNTKYI